MNRLPHWTEPSEPEDDGSSQGKVLHSVFQVIPMTILCLWGRWKASECSRRNSRTAVSRMCFMIQGCFWKDRRVQSAFWSMIQSLYNYHCNFFMYTNWSARLKTKPICSVLLMYQWCQPKPITWVYFPQTLSQWAIFYFKVPWKLNSVKKVKLHNRTTRIRPVRCRNIFWITVLPLSSNSERIADFCYCVAGKCIHLWSNFNLSPHSEYREQLQWRLGHNFTG